MSKFRKKGKRGMPAISTASLPDIVFMLLFFFMVTTVVRENDPKVMFNIPETDYTTKIEDRSKIGYIYVGTHPDGGQNIWEMNGNILNGSRALQNQIQLKKSDFENPEKDLVFVLKIDNETPMYEVSKIKNALKEMNTLKILYSSKTDE